MNPHTHCESEYLDLIIVSNLCLVTINKSCLGIIIKMHYKVLSPIANFKSKHISSQKVLIHVNVWLCSAHPTDCFINLFDTFLDWIIVLKCWIILFK